eukprot:15444275-Alexandrium_andersonii.AAC.1
MVMGLHDQNKANHDWLCNSAAPKWTVKAARPESRTLSNTTGLGAAELQKRPRSGKHPVLGKSAR